MGKRYERNGFESVFSCDISEAAKAVYDEYWKGRSGNKLTVKSIVDVVKGHESCPLPKADVVTGGFPCFAKGTLILSWRGFVPIESLVIGDLVLSHTGRWRKITSVMRRSGASLRRIRGAGILETFTTDEHPYYVRKCVSRPKQKNGKRTVERTFDKPSWISAKDICTTGRYFSGQVLPFIKQDNHSVAFWWLVGRYLADGWRVNRKGRRNGRVVICCNKREAKELSRRIASAGFHAGSSNERTVIKFHITRGDFYEFLEPFGKLASGKTLPGFAMCLDVKKTRALFDGWMSGDGYRNEKQHLWSGVTISRPLALSMALLAQRAYGKTAGVYFTPKPPKCIIEGRVCNQQHQYIIRVHDINRSSFVEGNYGWRLIRKSEPTGTGDVYNISVEKDESYVANGAIVHNCQDFSMSGKRSGFSSFRNHLGESVPCEAIESRGMLYLWLCKAVELIRPSVVIAENVKGLLSMPGALETIRSDFEALGYVMRTRLLDASDYGVPQSRDRVIFIGVRKDRVTSRGLDAIHGDEEFLFGGDDEFLYPRPFKDKTTCRMALGDLCEPSASTDPDQAAYSRVKWLSAGQGQVEVDMGGFSPTIRSEHHGNIEYRRLGAEHGGRHAAELAAGLPERRLSVRECARLQSFPDDYHFLPHVSASEAYKLIGNAVPPLLAHAIGRNLSEKWELLFGST